MTGAKSQIVAKGTSTESFGDCTELDRHDNQKWFDLGGVDVVVWGTDWQIFSDTKEAIDYIASVYGVEVDQFDD